jgi:hypothetical protein
MKRALPVTFALVLLFLTVNSTHASCEINRECPELIPTVTKIYKGVRELWVRNRLKLDDNTDAIAVYTQDVNMPFGVFIIDRSSNSHLLTLDYLDTDAFFLEMRLKTIGAQQYLEITPIHELYGETSKINYFFELNKGRISKAVDWSVNVSDFFGDDKEIFLSGKVGGKDAVGINITSDDLLNPIVKKGILVSSKEFAQYRLLPRLAGNANLIRNSSYMNIDNCHYKGITRENINEYSDKYIVCKNRAYADATSIREKPGIYVKNNVGYNFYSVPREIYKYFDGIGWVDKDSRKQNPRDIDATIVGILDTGERINLIFELFDRYEFHNNGEAGPGYSKVYVLGQFDGFTGKFDFLKSVKVGPREYVDTFYIDKSVIWYSVGQGSEYIYTPRGLFLFDRITKTTKRIDLPHTVEKIGKWKNWIVLGTTDGAYLVRENLVVRIDFVKTSESSYRVSIHGKLEEL